MTNPFPNPAPIITAEELATRLDEPNLRVYDCTTFLHPLPNNAELRVESGRAGYDEGHVPGAAFLDLAKELSDESSALRFATLDAASFARKAGDLGIGDDTNVVLYDRTYGAWGARVWWMLRGYGFDRARVLDGGLTNWRAKGHPIETRPHTYPGATFTSRPRSGHFVTREEVKSALESDQIAIVNALLPEQHAGSGGVHYGRPGRIPGSCNISSRAIVDPQTQAFLSVEELQQRFGEQGLLDGHRVIAYCGGGIAASLTALALTALGVKDVGVYMNSMQEWAKDETCPMERD